MARGYEWPAADSSLKQLQVQRLKAIRVGRRSGIHCRFPAWGQAAIPSVSQYTSQLEKSSDFLNFEWIHA